MMSELSMKTNFALVHFANPEISELAKIQLELSTFLFNTKTYSVNRWRNHHQGNIYCHPYPKALLKLQTTPHQVQTCE